METRPPLRERMAARLSEVLGPHPAPALDAAAAAMIEEIIREAEALYGDDRGLSRFKTEL